MRFHLCAWLALVFLVVGFRPAAAAPEAAVSNEEIRVRLASLDRPVRIAGVGLRAFGTYLDKKGGYQAVLVHWQTTAASSEVFHWRVEDRDSGRLLYEARARELEIEGSSLRFNLSPSPARISLRPAGGGKSCDIIARLDLESYVRGVLPAEMPPDWPLEALKAQAVAARTFALFRKRERAGAAFDVESSVMDQVFLTPVLSEERGVDARVNEAVERTRGLVLVAAKSARGPLAAYFHADCGGHTEDAVSVWGAKGAGTTACPFGRSTPWRAVFSLMEIERRLKPSVAGVRLVAISAEGQTASGRVRDILLSYNDGSRRSLSAHDFRMLMGYDKVKSTRFELKSLAGQVNLSGRGNGHGVGLCQWGARTLAQKGLKFEQILSRYYAGARLSTLSQI